MTLILTAIITQNLHKLSSTGCHECGHRICLFPGLSLSIIPSIMPPSKIEQLKDFCNIHFILISLDYALK